MRASQVANTSSSEYRGFIVGVVPARTNGPPSKKTSDPFPGDISWTAACVAILSHLVFLVAVISVWLCVLTTD